MDVGFKKTHWIEKHAHERYRYLCPKCGIQRVISHHPNPGSFKNFLRIGILTAVFVWASWPWFEWKGIVAFVPFWVCFEVIYRLRTRRDLLCMNCGFDPLLFLQDATLAKKEMEEFWRKRFGELKIPYPGDPPLETEVETEDDTQPQELKK